MSFNRKAEKRHITEAISITENLKQKSNKSLSLEKHWNGKSSIPLIGEHHDFYLCYIYSRNYGPSFADEPLTVVFNPGKDINTVIMSKAKKSKRKSLPIQDALVLFLDKLQNVNGVLEQPTIVFSVYGELCSKQHFFETSQVDKVNTLKNPHQWFSRDVAQTNALRSTNFSQLNCF